MSDIAMNDLTQLACILRDIKLQQDHKIRDDPQNHLKKTVTEKYFCNQKAYRSQQFIIHVVDVA